MEEETRQALNEIYKKFCDAHHSERTVPPCLSRQSKEWGMRLAYEKSWRIMSEVYYRYAGISDGSKFPIYLER